MEWKQALDEAIAQWEKVRQDIGVVNAVELVAEINAVCALCDKASETTNDPSHRCRYCLVFGTDSGCQEVCLKLSESLLDEDWESSRAQVDEMLHLFRETRNTKTS